MSGALDSRKTKDLQPATALWAQYRPADAPHRFRAKSPAEARRWQAKTRKVLAGLLGFQDTPAVPPRPRVLERTDRGDFTREKVLIRTAPHTLMPVYILKPKGAAGRLPVVLALHGHGYSVKDIVGLWEDGSERHQGGGYQKDFAVSLVRAGFLVAAPEISCFGARQTDFSHLAATGSPVPGTCAHTAFLAAHLGGTVLGLRVRDARRLVDYLATRRDADVSRLGAMGISGGGMHTLYSACLDERIRACVVSGYFCDFDRSILAMHHCPCNYVPGLAAIGDVTDLGALVAPRPMLIESASRDEIFLRPGVESAVRRARTIYRVFGAPDAFQSDYFEGRHEISGAKAYDFLREAL